MTDHQKIQAECADALSFMVVHNLVYNSLAKEDMSEGEMKELLEKTSLEEINHTLDAIMYLSGNDAQFIRSTAFSTLSSLSKYSS